MKREEFIVKFDEIYDRICTLWCSIEGSIEDKVSCALVVYISPITNELSYEYAFFSSRVRAEEWLDKIFSDKRLHCTYLETFINMYSRDMQEINFE